MDSGASNISEKIKEEIYEMISEMVEEQVFESLESIKGDIEELIRMIFSSEIKIDNFDQFTQERINSLREVFNKFKINLKNEILESIIESDFKHDLIKEIKKEIHVHPKSNGSDSQASIGRKKVILSKPKQKKKISTKKPKKA